MVYGQIQVQDMVKTKKVFGNQEEAFKTWNESLLWELRP